MQLKGRVITSIIIIIILLAAAILIWANQTKKITIWGDTGEEIIKTYSLSDSKSVFDSTPGVLSSCYDQYGWERRCYTVSLPLAMTSDIIARHTKAILRDYSFDNVGEMRVKAGNSSFVSVGGQYKNNTQSLSCGGGFKWNYTAGADISGLIDWYSTNTLSFTAMDCGVAFNGGGGGSAERVGGVVYLDIYGPKIVAKPVINSFSATPTSINAGQSSTLSWTTTNATSFSIDHGVGSSTNPNGSISVNPTSTTTYTLTATGPDGTATAQVTVSVQQAPVPTVSLTADNSTITNGGSTTLRWTSLNATSLSINNGIGTVAIPSGSKSVSPTATTTYTITATGSGSTTNQASTTITVNAASDTQVPSTPGGLTGSATSCSNTNLSDINLTWTASTDNVGVTGYEIYNADNNQLINKTSVTTWTITGANCATQYKYYVKAYDGAGNKSFASNTTTLTTPNGGSSDTQAPRKPTNLTAEGTSCTEIKLGWVASTDNVGIVGYDIYNSADNKLITTTSDTNYSFKSLAEKSTYGYFIKAHDAAGNISDSSNSVSLLTPACINGQGGTGGTGGGNLLSSLKTLVSTGQMLWFNLLIALLIAGLISYFILRKR